MNDPVSSSFVKPSQQQLFAFRRLIAPRGLTHQLIEQLTADIVEGRLPSGSRLPTEPEMMAATAVSRTVVREAVAALRADGLVVVRQGVGAFVADRIHRPFRIEVDGLRSLREVLDIMELRTGIEIEAAGLAAERASASDARRIIDAYEDIDRAIERGESAVDQDFAFHRTIAQCTGNAQFLHFLEYLGRFIIPRQSVRVLSPGTVSQRRYLIRIQKEHLRILEAIQDTTPASARESMRKHMFNSRKRYQNLASEIGEK